MPIVGIERREVGEGPRARQAVTNMGKVLAPEIGPEVDTK